MTRRIETVALVVLALFALTSCFYDNSPPQDSVPQGGVDTASGQVKVEDVWVDSTHGVRKGGDATLRLTLTNDGRQPDALVSASCPVARAATLAVHGKQVHRIAVPKQQSIDLERRGGSGVILHDVTRTLRPGDFFNATFRFTRSPAVTLAVAVGPLGGSLRSP